MRHSWPFVCLGTGREMYGVELYAAVRLAVVDEGLSHREAARRFGIDPRTVKKMPSYAVPPDYWRRRPVRRPKLEGFTGIIDAIPEARRRGIGYITPASGGSSKRNPVVGVLGVRHQNSAVLSPTAGVFPHPVQPFTQRHETVRFPGCVDIPERHSKLFQFRSIPRMAKAWAFRPATV